MPISPTTSVMLVTYNRLLLTQRMMASFFQTTTSPYHLIIVDNGSTDGTVEYLQQLQCDVLNLHFYAHCQNIDLQLNAQNKGIAIGRNQGLKLAAKYGDPFLATLDNDVELPMNWLQQCIAIIEDNPQFEIGVNMESVSYPLKTINGHTFQVKAAGNLGTACLVMPRSLHTKIGYFDTSMGNYSHEDANHAVRARMAGYQLGYLSQNGNHFGSGDLDVGEYREAKTKSSQDNLAKYQENAQITYVGSKIHIHPILRITSRPIITYIYIKHRFRGSYS